MEATLTSKGQITVPKPIRDRLRLHAGDRLEFLVLDSGHLEVIPRRSAMADLKGMVAAPVAGVTLEAMEQAIAKGACDDDRP